MDSEGVGFSDGIADGNKRKRTKWRCHENGFMTDYKRIIAGIDQDQLRIYNVEVEQECITANYLPTPRCLMVAW